MRIAIVEDEKSSADYLKNAIERYIKENADDVNSENIEVLYFSNGVDFLTNYKTIYDIIFMDIEMPDIDGLATARKLREMDSSVVLVFVTHMAQYAINGYEVSAFDYILKPVNYQRFSSLFKRLLRSKKLSRSDESYPVKTVYGVKLVPYNDIKYIEIMGHRLIFHTGEQLQSWGTLNDVETKLPSKTFVRVNSSFIVNLMYVTRMSGSELYVDGQAITISRKKKAEIKEKLAAYIGGGG